MTGLAWFLLAVGSLVCGDALYKCVAIWQRGTGAWVRSLAIIATAGQIGIFGYLVWVSL